jgi:hypothetical protein
MWAGVRFRFLIGYYNWVIVVNEFVGSIVQKV